jgi:hypothetical protein
MKKYKEFEYLKESNRKAKFKIGDVVLVLPKLKYYIEYMKWPKVMYDFIGKEVTIIEKDEDYYISTFTEPAIVYFIEINTEHNNKMKAYVFEDCIKLVNDIESSDIKKPRIRWYKKGKLGNDK